MVAGAVAGLSVAPASAKAAAGDVVGAVVGLVVGSPKAIVELSDSIRAHSVCFFINDSLGWGWRMRIG